MIKKIELNSSGFYNLSKFRKWMGLFLISLGGGTIYLVPYLLSTYGPQIGEITNISTTNLGLLMSVYGIVSLLLYIPGGYLADRLSTKCLFSISMIGTGIVTLWYSLIGFKGIHIDFAQLIIIHMLLAITTVLTFWSAFVKGIKLLGSTKEQASLYAKCDVMRNIIGCITGFITTSLVGVLIINSIFIPEIDGVSGSGIFLLIFTLAIIYIVVGILSLIILPGSFFSRIKKRNISGIFQFKNIKTGNIVICKTKEEYLNFKKIARSSFWNKVWIDLRNVLRNPAVWLISLLIFFTMNSYAAINSFGTYFSIDVGNFSSQNASYFANVYTYGAPILGALIAGIIVKKYIKNTSKTLFYINLMLIFIALATLLVPILGTTGYKTGIAGLVFISLSMVLIGASRGIFWSTITETKIPLSITGLAIGFISIIGFSKDIWVWPVLSVGMNAISDINSHFTINSFILTYGFSFINVIGAIIISYLLYKKSVMNKVIGKDYEFIKSLFYFKQIPLSSN